MYAFYENQAWNPPRGRTRFPQTCLNPHSNPKPAQKIGACLRHAIGHTVAVDGIAGFSRGPKPFHRPIYLTNRAKKPITQTLHRTPPLALTLRWREQWRKRRRIRGAHPYMTAQGDFRPEPAANAGQYRPARLINAPVIRRDNIATTASAAGAPTSRLRVWRWNIWLRMRRGGGVGNQCGA